jgi:AbrB family looped-hinge helix DNA binding protein
MIVVMDSAGRIVIPEAIREAVGFIPGMPLAIRVHHGRVEIEPPPRSVKLEKRGRLLVVVPEEAPEPLTLEDVDETRRELGDERGDSR